MRNIKIRRNVGKESRTRFFNSSRFPIQIEFRSFQSLTRLPSGENVFTFHGNIHSSKSTAVSCY